MVTVRRLPRGCERWRITCLLPTNQNTVTAVKTLLRRKRRWPCRSALSVVIPSRNYILLTQRRIITRMRQLNDCLSMAFAGSETDVAGTETDVVVGALEGSQHAVESILTHSLTTPSQETRPPPQTKQASIISMVRCIVSGWGGTAQTNFYIPQERLAGYSYLFENNRLSGRLSFNGEIHRNAHHKAGHTSLHGHHYHPAFVHAEEINSLHPHHYDLYRTSNNSTFNLTHLHANSIHERFLHHAQSTAISSHIAHNVESSQMTVPYIHPHLNVPVPPLHLPWYFGALCWSFAVAGVLMLSLPQKWARRVDRQVDNRPEEPRRHWFPYCTFAWALILCQSPCSFLADYVHMTNISVWHPIDRCLACILMSMELVKMLVMRPYTRPIIYILYLTCSGVAIFCFLKSQEAQNNLDADGFVFWHSGWHCYPITGSVVHLLDCVLDRRWEEYYYFDSISGVRKKRLS